MSRSEKFVWETEDAPIAERRPLAHVVLPTRHLGRDVRIEQLRGSDGVLALTNIVHMLPAAHELGLGPAVFDALVQLQKAGVCVWDFSLPDDLACIQGAAATLLAQLNA